MRRAAREAGSGATVLIIAVVVAGVVLLGLRMLAQQVENSRRSSDRSRASYTGQLAIESALSVFTQLLDAQYLYVCAHNVPTGKPSNANTAGPYESPIYCNASNAGKINFTYPAADNPASDWSWDLGTQTFTYRYCPYRRLTPAEMTAHFDNPLTLTPPPCTKIPVTVRVTNPNMTAYYFIAEASVEVSATTTTISTRSKLRLDFPNSCNPTPPTPAAKDFYAGYARTMGKKVRKIKSAADWKKIRPGGRYELDPPVPAVPIVLTKAEIDRTQRPLKNVVIDGGRDKGVKVRVMDDPTLPPEDNVGLFGDVECGTITEIDVEVGDDPPTPSKGPRPGKDCVGGLVGIVRRGLVSNSRVTDPTLDPNDPDHHIKGVTGSGAVIGCLDNPAFWHAQATSVEANAIIQTLANTAGEPVVAGGIAGINKGKIEDARTTGEIIAYLQNVAPHAFGGIAGWTLTDQGEILDAHNVSLAIVEKPGSQPIGNTGGVAGVVQAGKTAKPAVSTCTSKGSIDVKGAGVGGLIGTAGDVATKLPPSKDPTGAVTAVEVAESYSSCKVKGGDKVGGLIGDARGTAGKRVTVSNSYALPASGETALNPSIDVQTPAGRCGGLIGAAAETEVRTCLALARPQAAAAASDMLIGVGGPGNTCGADVVYDNALGATTTAATGLSIPQIIACVAPVPAFPQPPWALACGTGLPNVPATVADEVMDPVATNLSAGDY